MSFFRNQNGQSIVEAIVAAALISISGLGLSYSLKMLGDSKDQSLLVNRAVALESAVVAALFDPLNFPPNVQASLQNGQIPSNFELKLFFPGDAADDSSILSLPQTRVVDLCWSNARQNFLVVTETTSCGPDRYQVKIELRKFTESSVGANATTRYALAYFVASESRGSIGLKSVGAPDANFEEQDFQSVIPQEMYRSWDELSCQDNALLITGVDRDSGQPICMNIMSNPCPAGQFATGLEVVEGVLQLKCNGRTREIGCPANYSLANFNPQSLVVGATAQVQGECVFAAQRTEVLPPLAGIQLQGQVCPQYYRPTSGMSCSVQTLSQQEGTCFTNQWNLDAGSESTYRDGARDCRRRIQTYVEEDHRYQSQPNPGNLVQNSILASGINCEIAVPPQPCGAQWVGQVRISGGCELVLPERLPAMQVSQ